MTRESIAAFYRQFVTADDLVFDIGAYHGSRTAVFREIGARVFAAEPVRESVHMLFARFGADPRVKLVPRAVGACAGTADIVLSAPHRFSSSLSADYRRAGLESGRYARYGVTTWNDTRRVRVTTMDALIAEHGVPAFAKIDVEGTEDAVLAGLSQPVAALSFEFHPHALDPAMRCLDRLEMLGHWRFNFVCEERFAWELSTWVPLADIRTILLETRGRSDFLYGDVYARLVD